MDEDERQRIAALRSKLTDRKELTLAEVGMMIIIMMTMTMMMMSFPPALQRFRVLFALRNYDAARFPEAVDALLTGFADPSALLRHEIAFVLGQMQAERAVPTLIQVLDDESENSMVRHEAGEALGAIASEECGPALQKHLNDRLPEVYETCHLALERFKARERCMYIYIYVHRQTDRDQAVALPVVCFSSPPEAQAGQADAGRDGPR